MKATLIQAMQNWLKKSQHGAAMVLFAILLPFLLGMMGLAIDLGLAYAERAKLQDIADAAALAGGAHLKDANDNAVAQAVKASLEYNGLNPKTIGSLNGQITLADNENLAVTAGKAYADNKDDDAAAVAGTNLDRVRVRIAKRVPTFFLNVFSDKYSNGIPVQVAAAATGGSEPAGFKIVGMKGVYVNYTNFAHTAFNGPQIDNNDKPNKAPEKYVDGSVYAGPYIRVSASTEVTTDPNKTVEYESKDGTKFSLYGVNSFTVNGDIFSQRYNRGQPNTSGIANATDYLDNLFTRFRYLINPEGGDGNWQYMPLNYFTSGRNYSEGEFNVAKTTVEEQQQRYEKDLQAAKQGVIEAVNGMGGNVTDIDGALNWLNVATRNKNTQLNNSEWRYVTDGNNGFEYDKNNVYKSSYNVVVDLRTPNAVRMSDGVLKLGVYIDKLIVIGGDDSTTNIKKIFEIATRGVVYNNIYSETRLAQGSSGGGITPLSINEKLTSKIAGFTTWGELMASHLSDQSKKETNYFGSNNITEATNFYKGVIYSKGDFLMSGNGKMGAFFGKDSIIFSEESVLFGYGYQRGLLNSNTDKFDENNLATAPMLVNGNGTVPKTINKETGEVTEFYNYSDYILYKDSTKTGNYYNNDPSNLINASIYAQNSTDGKNALLPTAIVNGQVMDNVTLEVTYNGQKYSLSPGTSTCDIIENGKKKTITVDLNQYKDTTSDNNKFLITEYNNDGTVKKSAYSNGSITGTFTYEGMEMKFNGNQMSIKKSDGTYQSYNVWWKKLRDGSLQHGAYYNYNYPTQFMKYWEDRESFFKDRAQYYIDTINWRAQSLDYTSDNINNFYGDWYDGKQRGGGTWSYHEWEKGEPRKGGKLALVE